MPHFFSHELIAKLVHHERSQASASGEFDETRKSTRLPSNDKADGIPGEDRDDDSFAIASYRRRFWAMFVLGTLLYAFACEQRVAIPGAVFNQLQSQLGASASEIASLGSAFMYVYAAVQLVVGAVVARFGGIRTMTVGCLIFSCGMILFACSHCLPVLLFARCITGLGAGTFYLCLIHEILHVFRRNISLFVAIVVVIGYIGGIIANAPFTAVVNHWGLSQVLGSSAILAVILTMLFIAFAATLWKFHDIQEPQDPFRLKPYVEVLKTPHNRHLIFFSSLNWGIYYVVQTVIGKKFLEDFGGIPEYLAAWILSGMGIFAAASGFLFALVSRITGNRRQIFCRITGSMCLFVMGVTTFCIAMDWHTGLLGVLFCMLSMAASISSILVPLLKETNPPAIAPYAVAEMNFCFQTAVALFGNLAGILMNLFPPEQQNNIMVYSRNSYLGVFALLSLMALPACLYSFRIIETMGRQTSQDNH